MQGAHAAWTVTGFCAILVAGLGAAVMLEISLDRERTVAREMAANTNLARTLAENVLRTLRHADQTVQVLKHRYERERGHFDLRQYVRDAAIESQPFGALSIADEHGVLVQSNVAGTDVNISDREHFKVHVAEDSRQLFVSKPALGRTTGVWRIFLSRRINTPDGGFGGVALVGLDADYFSSHFRRIDLGPMAAITLIGMDGVIRARQSSADSTPGQNVSTVPLMTQRVRVADQANYIDTSSIDGVTRIFSYRRLRDYPLIVLVGTSEAVALDGANVRRTVLLSGAAVVGLLIFAFAALFAVQARRNEQTSLRSRADLEQHVAQRTAALTEAVKDLESFSYSVSHDLRSPLRAISGFAEILARRQRDRLDEQGRHYLDNIVEASKHMGRLIDDLLTYSRLGRQAVEPVVVPLSNVFAQIERHLETRIAALGAKVRFPQDAPVVLGDEILIYQIFLNLLDNALTYCQPGSPPVVEIDFEAAPGEVTVRVTDHGIGIAPDQLEAIFGVFQRLHSQEAYSGTGIGLATVRRSAELIGARVAVTSVPGSGSTFSVILKRSPLE